MVQLTHAVAGTDDVTYGCAADQALSDANAIKNADNFNVGTLLHLFLFVTNVLTPFQCFTTQVWANTKC